MLYEYLKKHHTYIMEIKKLFNKRLIMVLTCILSKYLLKLSTDMLILSWIVLKLLT